MSVESALYRWRKQHDAVAYLVSRLAEVERLAIERVAWARGLRRRGRFDDEQVREVEKGEARDVSRYEEMVRHGIEIRNKVEQELFFGKRAAPPPRAAPAAKT